MKASKVQSSMYIWSEFYKIKLKPSIFSIGKKRLKNIKVFKTMSLWFLVLNKAITKCFKENKTEININNL